VRLADKIKHVEDHHLLELIRDTHKPSGSATPLIEPIAAAASAAVVNAPAEKAFAAVSQSDGFAAVPVPVEVHQEQAQQEDYLWGV
jgi:hypothetical protein